MRAEGVAQRIEQVRQYIQENLGEDLRNERLAEMAGFSPFHFHRVFTGITGEGVGQFIRRLRMGRAAEKLRTSDETVSTIAHLLGYATYEGFSRAFRQAFGMSPTEYRELSRDELPWKKPEVKPMQISTERPVRLVTIPTVRVATMRHLGPYERVTETFTEFWNRANAEGWWVFGRSRQFGIYLDDPVSVPPEELRFECCISVQESFEAREGIEIQELAGGDYAVVMHRGAYSGLTEAYQWAFGVWLPKSGLTLRNVRSFEEYVTTPQAVPEVNVITEIYIPLERLLVKGVYVEAEPVSGELRPSIEQAEVQAAARV